MRMETYLCDDNETYERIRVFVNSVLDTQDCTVVVGAWLKQQFGDVYDHLDPTYIEWDTLAEQFVREIAPVADEDLPRLVVVLTDAARWLDEECPDELRSTESGASKAVIAIGEWQHLWEMKSSVSGKEFVRRCRQAPPQFLLTALARLTEALRGSQQFVNDGIFWTEMGDGATALRVGQAAMDRTWWQFHPLLREWADHNKGAIGHALGLCLQRIGTPSQPAGVLWRDRAHARCVRRLAQPYLWTSLEGHDHVVARRLYKFTSGVPVITRLHLRREVEGVMAIAQRTLGDCHDTPHFRVSRLPG